MFQDGLELTMHDPELLVLLLTYWSPYFWDYRHESPFPINIRLELRTSTLPTEL